MPDLPSEDDERITGAYAGDETVHQFERIPDQHDIDVLWTLCGLFGKEVTKERAPPSTQAVTCLACLAVKQ